MPELEYEHYLYAPTKEAADAMLGELQRAGGIAVEPPEPSAAGRGDWLARVVTSYSEIDTLRDRFRAIAAKHGGEYDGGGTYVA